MAGVYDVIMRTVIRRLAFTPGFLASTVAVLALGLAASTLVFAIAQALVLNPLEFADPGRLVQLQERLPHSGGLAPLTAAGFREAQGRTDRIESPAAVDMGMFTLTGVAEPEEFAGAAITVNTLDVLGVKPLLGHNLSAREPDEVLLTYATWKRRFNSDPKIVGRTIDLDWSRTAQIERYRVAGVLPERFWLIYRGLEVFVPLTDDILSHAGPRRRYLTFGRTATAGVAAFAVPLNRSSSGSMLVGSSLEQDLTASTRPALLSLSAAALGLLLLACANVASLFLVRSLRRRSEFEIRLALGASGWHLARIVLAEAAFVTVGAAVLATPLVYYGLAWLRRWLAGEGIGRIQFTPGLDKLEINAWTLGFVTLAALVSCLLASALPAWKTSAAASGLHGSSARQPYRQILIGLEIALATLLVCGAGLLIESVARINRANVGVAVDHMLVVRVPKPGGSRPTPAYYSELERRILTLPGVDAVAFASFQPLTHTQPSRRFSILGGVEDAAGSYCVVSPNFFSVYRVALRAGRTFNQTDRSTAPPVVVINESLARKYFPNRSPLGERIQLQGETTPSEIVGVVASIRQSLEHPAPEAIYRSTGQDPSAGLQMGVRTQVEPTTLALAIRREIGLAGGVAAELSTLDDFEFSESWRTRVTGFLMTAFSLLALAVAGFGVFCVVSYAVSQRRREMGIRATLGARPGDIVKLLIGEGLRPVCAGLVAGLIAAFALSGLLKGLLYEVEPADPKSYFAAALVLLAAAGCALAIPASRAARVDPGAALRQL